MINIYDRISTYKGRYELTPVPGQPNKFDITRADEPIQDGTPLTKKNVLQDDTAAMVGLDEDCTLDDFLKILANGAVSLVEFELPAANWSGTSKPFTQTVTVNGVLSDETKQAIWPTPKIASMSAWDTASIKAVNQDFNSLTFQCQKKPTSNIYGYALIMGVNPKGTLIPKKLNNCSWELISDLSASGELQNYFKVGDSKKITINGKVGNTVFNNVDIELFIVGFDHNQELESPGEHRTHFQMGKINGIPVCLIDDMYAELIENQNLGPGYFCMNETRTNAGGWESSQMRSIILGGDSTPKNPKKNTLMATLPQELRNVMKPVTKYTDNVGFGIDYKESSVTATTEYLTLFGAYEYLPIGGSTNQANKYEKYKQKPYELLDENYPMKYEAYETQTIDRNRSTWTRSASLYGERFCNTNKDGGLYNSVADESLGIAPLLFI